MGIRSIKGLATAPPIRTSGTAALPIVSSAPTAERFRDRLQTAVNRQAKPSGMQLTTKASRDSVTEKRSSSISQQNGLQIAPEKNINLTNRRNVGDGVRLPQGTPHRVDMLKRRLRRHEKWLRRARDAIRNIESALQIHISGVMLDANQDTLTVFIEQDCWPEVQFVLQRDESMWHLLISTPYDQHKKSLSEYQPLLVQRFADAELGMIDLSLEMR